MTNPKPALDLNKIIQFPFPELQYYKEESPKSQIVIHHTVSGPKAENVFLNWQQNPERVATALVISGDGTIVQGFSSKYWAHHLGLHAANNTTLNKGAVAIEICNWGGLTFDGTNYKNIYGGIVPAAEVFTPAQPFRSFKYFHRYNAAQIESLRQLLVFLCDRYNISKAYNQDMWDISANAMAGKNGIYTHVSYRADKSDCYPDPQLIAMLQSL